MTNSEAIKLIKSDEDLYLFTLPWWAKEVEIDNDYYLLWRCDGCTKKIENELNFNMITITKESHCCEMDGDEYEYYHPACYLEKRINGEIIEYKNRDKKSKVIWWNQASEKARAISFAKQEKERIATELKDKKELALINPKNEILLKKMNENKKKYFEPHPSFKITIEKDDFDFSCSCKKVIKATEKFIKGERINTRKKKRFMVFHLSCWIEFLNDHAGFVKKYKAKK